MSDARGLLKPWNRPKPAITLPAGSVMLIGHNDDLADDVCEAIDAMGSSEEVPLTPDAVRRILGKDLITAGLRAEAGLIGGGRFICLHTRRDQLSSGLNVLSWLMLTNVFGLGDALIWQVGIGHDLFAWFATQALRDVLLDMLRQAAGGPSTETVHVPSDVPSDDELRELDKL
jgi:hypothetical protein